MADIHANQPALSAVLERESEWDELLFLGDAVDAGPHPNEVLETLAELPGEFVAGNHDRAVVNTRPESPPAGSDDFRAWTSAELTDANREFLAGFGPSQRVETPTGPVRLHHGDFEFDRDDVVWDGRPWPDTDPAVYETLADRYDAPTVLVAHSHVQFELDVGGTRFVNPGSVGQHRLQQVEACYALLDGDDVHLRACEYDADRTVDDLNSLPLDEEYLEARERIYTEGVLPGEMRDFESLRERGYR